MYTYKVGDIVKIQHRIYKIVELPGTSWLSNYYTGIDINTDEEGMFPEEDIDCLVITVTNLPRKKPIVTKNDQICYFDVDQTLVLWEKEYAPGMITADYYGQVVNLTAYEPHIRFLKAMKARGGHIVVQSGNGWAWAEQVVCLLQLEAFVDEIKSKPSKVIDDSDYENWMPTRIFINE